MYISNAYLAIMLILGINYNYIIFLEARLISSSRTMVQRPTDVKVNSIWLKIKKKSLNTDCLC